MKVNRRDCPLEIWFHHLYLHQKPLCPSTWPAPPSLAHLHRHHGAWRVVACLHLSRHLPPNDRDGAQAGRARASSRKPRTHHLPGMVEGAG